MCGWCVEGKEVPEKTPSYSDGTGRVENHLPSKVSDDESAQRIGQPDPKAEP